MPLQDLNPINDQLADIIVRADEPWIETAPGMAWKKVLWTGSETGRWVALFRWKRGYVAAPHKHLSDAHTYVLKGKLKVRDGVLEAGDYDYEPCGVLHGKTEALEDTEYLFVCDGAIIYYDDDGLTRYQSWEELERLKANEAAPRVPSEAEPTQAASANPIGP